MIYEFANSMAARGHETHVVHIGGGRPDAPSTLDDLPDASFHSAISHDFLVRLSANNLPPADVAVNIGGIIDAVPDAGLPVAFVQGYGTFAEEIESRLYHLAGL